MIDKTVFSINLWDVYQKEGRQCAESGDLDGALERFQAALEKAQSYGKNDPRVATSKRCLAEVLVRQGKTDEAGDLFEQSLALLENELGEDSASLLKTLHSYGDLLGQLGDKDKLDEINARISEIESKSSDTMITSDIFEEAVPENAADIPLTPEQRMRILELLQRTEVSDRSRDQIMAKLEQNPSYQWAHETQGKLRQEIVRSYQPISLRNPEDEEEFNYD